MKLVLWLLMAGLLHLVQRGGALLAVPNVTAHQSMASVPFSVPVTVLLYSGMLLCGFNVH